LPHWSALLCNLELHGPVRLLLQNAGARHDACRVADILNSQLNQIARSQLAVDGEVE